MKERMLVLPVTTEFAGLAERRPGLAELMRLHERQVLAVALRLTGNLDDAKDIAQEAFLRLHKHLASVEGGAGAWLYRTTVNLCQDHLRKARRLVAIAPLEPVLEAKSPGPEARASEAQRRERLHAALAHLGAKERAALVLRDMEGLSTAEVAEALGSTESTVRVQISKARLKLREILRGEQ